MYLHLMRKNKVVQILVIENEEFLKENEEFLMKEFEADSFLVEKEQLTDLDDDFIEEKRTFSRAQVRYAEAVKDQEAEVIKKVKE